MTKYGKDVTCLFINYFQQGLNYEGKGECNERFFSG